MNTIDIRIWLILGLVPYHTARKRLADGSRLIQVRALFWSFETRRPPKGPRNWTLHLILIERLRGTLWAVVDYLRGRASR